MPRKEKSGEKPKVKPEPVLVLCAHNDDQIIGLGGTLSKYASQGKKIIIVIFSYGEASHPHFKENVVIKTRVKESKESDKVLAGANFETYYLGLKEGKFQQGLDEKGIMDRILSIIKKRKPAKIFTHSPDDPHPDHKVVFKFTMDLVEKSGYDRSVYSYNVWNLFLIFRNRDLPKLVVDISDTFGKKVEALRRHKSQWITARVPLTWSMYARALLNGLIYHKKLAEVFVKVR